MQVTVSDYPEAIIYTVENVDKFNACLSFVEDGIQKIIECDTQTLRLPDRRQLENIGVL